jgi:hypothetical protein
VVHPPGVGRKPLWAAFSGGRAEASVTEKTKSNATPRHATSSVDQSRKSAGEPYASLESASDPPTSSHGRSGGIAWSLWRRAHQAAAQKSHLKQKSQL